jgi:hypothetical protein
MCGIEWNAGNVAVAAWAMVALIIWCLAMISIVKGMWRYFSQIRVMRQEIEKAEAPPMPAVRRPFDGSNGNGYQPLPGQDRPVAPPPRSP